MAVKRKSKTINGPIIDLLEKIETDPDDPQLLTQLAILYLLNLEDKKAEDTLSKVFTIRQNFIPALVAMAELKNYGVPIPNYSRR